MKSIYFWHFDRLSLSRSSVSSLWTIIQMMRTNPLTVNPLVTSWGLAVSLKVNKRLFLGTFRHFILLEISDIFLPLHCEAVILFSLQCIRIDKRRNIIYNIIRSQCLTLPENSSDWIQREPFPGYKGTFNTNWIPLFRSRQSIRRGL